MFHITDKPRFKNPMKFEVSGEFGKEINLPCDVVGTPDPNVTWYRDGVPLAELPNLRYKTMGEDVEKNYLKISFLKLDDSGMFQCKASNEAGEVVGYSWLRVKSK
jgi:protein sidekick